MRGAQCLAMACCALLPFLAAGADTPPSAADYPSVQAAVDANPGRMVLLPEGDYSLSERVRIAHDGSGLYGFGRLIQSNPAEPVLEVRAADVRLRDITLTRAPGAEDATESGLFCQGAKRVEVTGVRVFECRARNAAVMLSECADTTIRDCVIRNYKRIAVDDRTAEGESLYGYAFRCIDGTGILAERCTGTIITGNRIIEERLLPTRENKEQHQLGALTEGRYPTRPGQLGQTVARLGYANNWHQGSAIVVTAPEVTRQTQVCGNHIENAAQGIDLHCDHAVVSGNVINHGLMGIKLTHGCRNVIVSENLISHVDLWGILLNPGAASHAAEADKPANVDAGIVVTGNIITDYGYGHEFWNYGGVAEDCPGSYAMAFYEGQLDTNPPLSDVLVTGNLVYDSGGDQPPGGTAPLPPRYRYAVYIGPWGESKEPGPTFPRRLHFAGNSFQPGLKGTSNIPLPE